jgi:hypothetical protein
MRTAPLASLLSALLALSVGAARGEEPAPARSPPPGGEDAALLEAMRAAYVGLNGERAQARLVLGELQSARYDERLAARARAAGEDAPKAEAARARLAEAGARYAASVGGRQPVDPRAGCRFQAQALREALSGAPGSPTAQRVPAAREDARACLARLQASLDRVRTSAADLRLAMADAKAVLGSDEER